MPGEDIGEYDGDYIDSQENFLYASHLSCEELEAEDFMEGDYANDEVRSLEDIWWPAECMHSVHTFSRSNERRERGRKKKRGECGFSMGEALGPPFLQNSPPLVDLGGNFVEEEEEEGHVQPPQSLGGDFEVRDLAPELGGFEEHSYSSGEGNAYDNVEWSDDERDGGDLGDGTWGDNWVLLSVAEFKAWLAIWLYMDMNRVVIPGVRRPFWRANRAGGRAALSITPYMNRAGNCRR
jgi:hypothetical protein